MKDDCRSSVVTDTPTSPMSTPLNCISSRVEKGLWVMNWVFRALIRKPNRVEMQWNGVGPRCSNQFSLLCSVPPGHLWVKVQGRRLIREACRMEPWSDGLLVGVEAFILQPLHVTALESPSLMPGSVYNNSKVSARSVLFWSAIEGGESP